MIDLSFVELDSISIHHVGNPLQDETLKLSKTTSLVEDDTLKALLYKYFLSHFETPEHYHFSSSSEDPTLNPIFRFASSIFESPVSLQEQSENIARHLYGSSQHPNIKAGDLCVVYFNQINYEDEVTDAIGIFKSESKETYLKLIDQTDSFELDYEQGINVNKPDKACLIFNAEKSDGYRVFILDKSNRNGEAQFWKDTFLQLKECSNNYTYTNNMLTMTRSFVKHKMKEDFDVEKADEIDLLNKTINYFKENESYDQDDFSNRVFQNEELASSFQTYQKECVSDLNLAVEDTFDISYPAVKKQSRVFKSVIKLDKNFHIYVHGDRQKIEKGVDASGNKFYRLFYDDES
jgi:hypothetical protein